MIYTLRIVTQKKSIRMIILLKCVYKIFKNQFNYIYIKRLYNNTYFFYLYHLFMIYVLN